MNAPQTTEEKLIREIENHTSSHQRRPAFIISNRRIIQFSAIKSDKERCDNLLELSRLLIKTNERANTVLFKQLAIGLIGFVVFLLIHAKNKPGITLNQIGLCATIISMTALDTLFNRIIQSYRINELRSRVIDALKSLESSGSTYGSNIDSTHTSN